LEDIDVKLTRFSPLAAGLLAGALVLTACGGSDDNNSSSGSSGGSSGGKLSGKLTGAGSTAQQAAMQAWAAGFQNANSGVTVSYDPVGSGGGREQFLAGGVIFAGSDDFMTTDELAKSKSRCAGGKGAIDIPVYVSPIAVAYNLPGVMSLQLAPSTIAQIFAGKITKWDDPAIKQDNPGAKLPSTNVTPVHRSDDSGTTENFTDYMSKTASNDWTYPPSGTWPLKNGEGAEGTSGVIQAIEAGNGTIGYADASQAKDLSQAAVKVGSSFNKASAEGAAKVAGLSKVASGRPPHDLAIEIDRTTTAAGAYPVMLISYQLVCLRYSSKNDGATAKAFEKYVVSPAGQQAAASAAGSAPLADALRQKALESINQVKN